MRRLRWLLAAGAALWLGCDATPSGPPHLLLITVDTLRPDRLSAYGYAEHATPNIDRLAREGALYENAFTDTPWTTPSMVSVMTGVHGPRHGYRSTNVDRLGLHHDTLAEILRDRGYATAAIIGSFPLDSIYQLDQGFAHYDDRFTRPIWLRPDHEREELPSQFHEDPADQAFFTLSKALNDSRRSDDEVTDAALAWLEANVSEGAPPFFLWVHYFGPHTKPDWSVPEEARQAQHVAQYDPDVLENDAAVGRLLDALDAAALTDDTLVVFHADHGESLGEQAYYGHGHKLNEATMRIPLLVRYPGRVAAGLRVETFAKSVDIFPTLLAAAGAPIPAQVAGRNLLPDAGASLADRVGRLGSSQDARAVYMETYYPAHAASAVKVTIGDREVEIGFVKRAVRQGRWRFERIEPHPLLDARHSDFESLSPGALQALRREVLQDVTQSDGRDRSREQPEKVAELAALLEAELAERGDVAPTLPVDEEIRLRLKSLGYGGD